jgi:hypothetical protein
VEVFADGAGLRVEAIAGEDLEERDGRLVVPPSGVAIDDEMIRALRDLDSADRAGGDPGAGGGTWG